MEFQPLVALTFIFLATVANCNRMRDVGDGTLMLVTEASSFYTTINETTSYSGDAGDRSVSTTSEPPQTSETSHSETTATTPPTTSTETSGQRHERSADKTGSTSATDSSTINGILGSPSPSTTQKNPMETTKNTLRSSESPQTTQKNPAETTKNTVSSSVSSTTVKPAQDTSAGQQSSRSRTQARQSGHTCPCSRSEDDLVQAGSSIVLNKTSNMDSPGNSSKEHSPVVDGNTTKTTKNNTSNAPGQNATTQSSPGKNSKCVFCAHFKRLFKPIIGLMGVAALGVLMLRSVR